ncbi:hypothetical protein AAC387_Pa03g4142 [Persea americana]
MTPNWYRGDLGPHLGPRALVNCAPIGFASAEELGGEVEVLKPVIGNSSGEMRLCGLRMGIKWFGASTIRRRLMHLVRLPSRARQTTSPLENENQPSGSLSEKSCRNFADGCTCRQMTE